MEKKNESPHIVAVVVTYNRFQLLQQCIEALRRNRPERIIVVNNGSTDDTEAWLDTQTDLHVVHQENVGGSGGFYTGIQQAMQAGADWIWCMDDDVRPHDDCLAHLLPHCADAAVGIMAPRRLMEGKVFTNDFCRYNLTNPLRSMYQDRLRGKTITQPTDIVGTAFEGLFVSRAVVERIGLPNRDLFIFCDDTDYCLRAHLAGFRILYVPDALMDKERFFSNDTWPQRQEKKKWKRPYQVRNAAYLNHHYGRTWGVRYLRSLIGLLGYLLTILVTAPFRYGYRWRDAATLIRAYRDGLREHLGRITPTSGTGNRLIMTLLVKNEEDMLEQNLLFHKAMGVDAFVVTDNNSTDGTPDIIRRYQRPGWIEAAIQETGTDYQQKRWVDRMIRLASRQLGARWIINADADELWYAPSGNLKQELEQCGGNVAHCQIRSMYPQPNADFTQWTRRVEFVDDQQAYGLSPYSIFQRQRGKVAHRAQGYLRIGMGNHKVHMWLPRRRECGILIYHYNVRGREAFVEKMVNGGQQMEAHPNKKHASHWRYFYRLYKEGRLSEEYDRVIGMARYDQLVADGRIVEDTTVRDMFAKLAGQDT